MAGDLPFTLSAVVTVASGVTGQDYEIKHDNKIPFVCDERDIVIKLNEAVAPYPSGYPLSRNPHGIAANGVDTVLPSIDQVSLSARLRDVEMQLTNKKVSAGSFASRTERGLQRTKFKMVKEDTIRGTIDNNTGKNITVEIIFKGYLNGVPSVQD